MKKKLTRLYYVFWSFLIAYLFLAFSSNPPNGYTGSPASGQTCASASGGCHSGGTGTGTIDITGLPGTIDPNTTYPITVSITRTNNAPNETGFQLDVLDDNNDNFGTLSNPGPGSTVQSNFFEHSPSQPFSTNTVEFTVDWTSPSMGSTTVTMYAASLLANGTGGTGGDATIEGQVSGSFMGSAGPIDVTVTGTDVNCFGGSDGTATASASGGGGGPYTYNWSNGMSGEMITNLPAGSYTVTATNMNGGDPGDATIMINEPATDVEVIITQTLNIDCNNPVGSATAEATGGTPGYSYEWSDGSVGPTINVTMAGNYEVTATDFNGCTATVFADIMEDTAPPIADAGPPMVITCTVSSVILDGSNSSAGPNISYEWTTLNGNIVSGANSTSPEVDAAGTYTLTVTNEDNGCTETDETTVISNVNVPIIVIAAPEDLTCIVTQVTLDATGSSTGADISYLWTTANGNIVSGETTLMPMVDAGGEYTLTITNSANGCINSSTVSVTEDNIPPIAEAGANMVLNCNNTSVVLNGSGSSAGSDFSYLWTTVDGNIVSGETTTMPTVDAAGTYTLTVTNNINGCLSTDNTVVTQTPDLMASISNTTDVDCNGNSTGSATAMGSGGNGMYSYSWSNGEMTQTIMNLAAGSYIVTVTDEDNCTATATAVINEPDELTATVTTMDVSMAGANDGSATTNPMGGTMTYTYVWSNGASTQTISNLAPGTYTVTVTDNNGCTVIGSGTVNSFDCSGFSATISSTDVTCNGGDDGSATATPAGGTMPYTYVWSDGQTTQTAIDLTTGNYSVTVSETDGCTQVLMTMIAEPSAVSISADEINHVSCNGGADGSITVSASGGNGGYSYFWSNGAMGATIMNLSAGSYTVTATDNSGCDGILEVTITEPTVLSLTSVSITNVLCHGDSTGAATVAAAGGTPAYTYQWPGGATVPSQTGLPAGSYNVTVTDANSCTSTYLVDITQPSEMTLSVMSTDETGVGLNDGTASATPTGGTGNYTYVWNNNEVTQSISNLSPGEYCVTVTDGNGCSKESCTTVNAFACAGVSLETNGVAVSCFEGNDGSASVTPTGLTSPITYLWSNDSTTATIDGLSAGAYSVMVTGSDGCSATTEFTVSQPPAVSISAEITNTMCEDSADGAINVGGEGGTPGYTFIWSNGAMGSVLDSLPSGTYTVIATDMNGCSSSQEFAVGTDPDIEIPNVVLQNITVELDASGMASISAPMLDNGSTDNCGIDTMIVDITDFNCSHIGANEVVVSIQDLSNNCGFGMATVTVQDNLPPSIACPDDISVQSDNCEEVVSFDDPLLSDNCGNPTFSVIEGLPSSSTFPSGTTTVTLEATDGSGNTSSCSFEITIDNGFSGTTTSTNVTCNGFNDGTATANVNGGMMPFSYEWDDDNNQTEQTATNLSPNTYSVTITDASGCTTVASVDVTEPPALEIAVDEITPDTLSNNQGAISVTVTGGTGDYSYEWESNGMVVSMDEDPSGLAAGTYLLTIVDDNGCTLSSDSIFVDLIINTLDASLSQYIGLYPNPVFDKLSITFDLPTTSAVNIGVFNLNGQIALPEQVGYFSKKTMELDVNELSAGIYTVRMVVDEGVFVKRVVVGN